MSYYYYLVVSCGFQSRIGIFGGTFDPPHNGHLSAALFAREELGLEIVLMTVANEPWQKTMATHSSSLKEKNTLTSAKDRFEMLRAALGPYEKLEADDCEIKRGGLTYTTDTLTEVKNRFPESELILLLGADVANNLETWKKPDEVFEHSKVVVMTRPGVDHLDLPHGRKFEILHVPSVDVSGSQIRECLIAGESVNKMLPESVLKYIRAENLYQEKI